jgi:hypothetical protein
MERIEIKSVNEFLEYIYKFDQQQIAQWIFRGQGNNKYDLIPSLFRIELQNTFTNWKDLEEYILKVFKREARPFKEFQVEENNDCFELNALAQHHGLPTRLLDWTTNALIALFFAVEDYDKNTKTGYVWCYGFPSTNNCLPTSTRIDRKLLFEKENFVIFPSHISPRITNQSACFTIHELPIGKEKFIPFNKSDVSGIFVLFIINKNNRKNIFDQLYDLGYHHGLVYPGLDGISKRIKYEAISTHKRNSNEQQLKDYYLKNK